MTAKRIHFIAIAGTGMGSLAGLLRARGHHVTGSDTGVYPPMSVALEKWGIPVSEGFDAERMLEERPDLVVIGNVVRAENPEARAAIERGIPYLSFPDALYRFAIDGKHSVVVTGTHGKTTVTSMVASLLLEAGRDPSVLVAGISRNLDGSFREGEGPHFVVEGDEYDTAFFDKTPKFLHYGARTLILTSVEFDHADIYRDLDHVMSAFQSVIEKLPKEGVLVANVGDANVRKLIEFAPCPVLAYGLGRDPELEREVEDRLLVYGRHNVANALAAVTAVGALGVRSSEALEALSAYRGVARRQEVRGEVDGVLVIDDFAHHPTAVRETVAAVAERHPTRRLLAVFEPRSNTSRRAVFQAEYAQAFAGADRVLVSRVPDAPIYSATGEVTERFSADTLVEALAAGDIDASAYEGPDAILAEILRDRRKGDVVLIMSNGAFGNLCTRLLEALDA